MTIINPNSIAGITSVTAEAGVMNFYKSDGTLAGLQLNGVNFNTTAGVSTFNNVYVGGTITYEDVKNVDSVGIITAREGIFLPDNKKIQLGAGNDCQIYHDGSHNIFFGVNGADFKIKDASNNSAIFDTSAGVELFYANSKKFETTAAGITVSGHIDLDDSNFLKAGTGDDLWVGHDGNHSYINHNGTGGLFVQSSGGFFVQKYGTTERLINANNDGNVELFYDSAKKLETTSTGITVTGDIRPTGHIYLGDNDILVAGASEDLQIYHSTNNIIDSKGQNVQFRNIDTNGLATDTMLSMVPNGGVYLYHDNNLKLETRSDGVSLPADDQKIKFGASNELIIYHHNNNWSYITHSGSGNLGIESVNDIVIRNTNGEVYIDCNEDGSVELYHNNSKRLETDTTGINVTGRTAWVGGTSAETQSVYLSAGTSNPTQIGMFNGHGGKQGFCFYNNGSGSYKSWGMITDQQNLYFKSAPYNIGNTSDLTTNWTDRMTLSNSGRLGVGTNSPFNKLTLKGDGDDVIDIIYSGTSGGHESKIQFRDKRDFVNAQINNNLQDDGSGTGAAHLEFKTATSGSLSTRLQIDRNGVFTFNPGGRLHVRGGTADGSQDTVMWIDKQNNNDWLLKLECGTGSSTDYGCYVRANNSASYGFALHNLSAWKFRVAGNGTIYSANTSVQSISDVRLKENIVDANSQWDDIKGLRFRNYNWKPDSGHADGKTYLGLIAQEVETISPNLVEIDAQDKEDIDNGVPDPEYKNVNYSIVWMKAVKALQEAQARIETLEAEVAALKSS